MNTEDSPNIEGLIALVVDLYKARYQASLRGFPMPDDPTPDVVRHYIHRFVANEGATVQEGEKVAGFVKPDNDRQVFFYEQDFYVLSNFSAFNLLWRGIVFPTSEHAYHYEKFYLTKDGSHCICADVLEAPSAHEAFKIAERNKARRRPDWDDVKVRIMRDILRAKVDQHEYVRRKLLATGDRELIEDSWRDDFWGWGPNRDGQNMLGKLWMEVRAALRSSEATRVGEQGGVAEGGS